MMRIHVLLGLLLMGSAIVPGMVQAHSADTFTVVIKQSGLTPSTSQITYNDSVVWHNTDGRENLTHRVVFDVDGDGLYNGTGDWDSGELVAECDSTSDNSTENNSSSDCNITFMVWFNGTFGVGEYNYQDLLSDGTVLNGTIVVMEDVHIENSTSPAIGSTFGATENENVQSPSVEEEDDGDDVRRLILMVGGLSGLGALGLIVLLLIRRS